MKYLLPFAFLFLALSSCKKILYYQPATAEVTLDVAYGNDPYQKMDVYLPAERTSAVTHVVILLHGGAFVAGQKEEFTAHAKVLQQQGYAVFNVNYRLVDGEGLIFPPYAHKESAVRIFNQLDDIRKAVDFIALNARKYMVSDKNWAMAGHSAGGTLALLYAYGTKNNTGQIKAVANWAGVADFSYDDEMIIAVQDPRLAELYYRLTGKLPVNANRDDFKAISPIWQARTANNIPTINIRPENNSMFGLPDLSAVQYAAFTATLNAKPITNSFVEIKGADHDFSGNWAPVLTATVEFFKTNLK